MTIAYLKKASKTPATGTDETRRVVTEMLSNIEQGGEAGLATALSHATATRAGLGGAPHPPPLSGADSGSSALWCVAGWSGDCALA